MTSVLHLSEFIPEYFVFSWNDLEIVRVHSEKKNNTTIQNFVDIILIQIGRKTVRSINTLIFAMPVAYEYKIAIHTSLQME